MARTVKTSRASPASERGEVREMALECDPPHLGDIGDREREHADDPLDHAYDAWAEKRREAERP